MKGNGRFVKRGVVTTQVAHPNQATTTASVNASARTEARGGRTRAAPRPAAASQQAGDS